VFKCCLQALRLRSPLWANIFHNKSHLFSKVVIYATQSIIVRQTLLRKVEFFVRFENVWIEKKFGEQILIFSTIKGESKRVLNKNFSCLKHILVSFK